MANDPYPFPGDVVTRTPGRIHISINPDWREEKNWYCPRCGTFLLPGMYAAGPKPATKCPNEKCDWTKDIA
jgi:RNase P subunit RPR2